MAKVAILFGALLIGLGVLGYSGGGSTPASDANTPSEESSETSSADSAAPVAKKKSPTALIPAGFGVGLLICGVLALKESLLKHAMHGGAMIGLLGLIAGAGKGATGLGKFFSGDPSLNQRGFLFTWLMALLCGVFVALCVRSFIAAKKRREAEMAA